MAGKKGSTLTQAVSLSNEDKIYVIDESASTNNKSKIIRKDDFANTLNLSTSSGSRLVSGSMQWVSGLTYQSINLTYEISGEQFVITDGTIVTLDAADGSNPRIDLIFGDDLGALNKSTGTPAPTPTANTLLAHQFQLKLALVATSATEPTGVSIRTVYTENVGQPNEFDATESTSAARIDLANTTSPLTGTKDIKTTAAIVNADLITFVHATATTIANLDSINLDLKNLANWGNDYLILTLLDSSVEVGTVSIDSAFLDVTNTTTTQTVTIQKSDFSLVSGQTEFDKITIFNRVRGTSAILYQLDEIYIFEDAGSTEPTVIPTHTGQVTGDTELSVDVTAITDQTLVTAAGADTVLIMDATDGELKKSLISDFASAGGDMAAATYDPATIAEQLVGLTATQTLSAKTLASPSITGNTTTTGLIDGRDVATDGTKLDGIETSATADQTDAEIRTAVEAATDSNVFTDADHTKLNGVESLADVTDNANVNASGVIEYIWEFAFGDETTDLSVSTGNITFDMPDFATTLTKVSVNVVTAPTGSVATFDFNEAGVSVLSTKVTIDATEKTSETAATPPVISDSALAANATMSVDTDGIGSTIAGAGGKMIIYFTKT